jgi:thiol-disulfide isomerase/thioredoxin
LTKYWIVFFGFYYQVTIGQIPSFDTFKDFEKKYLASPTDTACIFNFWATWCKPCVEELPYLTEAANQYKNSPVKIIFVSLDSKKDKNKLAAFTEKNLANQYVVHLTDHKYNDWIDRLDPSWSGSIPATLFIKGQKRAFNEKQFESFHDLHSHWLTFLKQ